MRSKIIFIMLLVFVCPIVLSSVMYPNTTDNVIQEKQKKKKTEKKDEKSDSFKTVDQWPEVKKGPNPEYPESDKKANTQGVVYLKVLVSETGTVKEVTVAKREKGSVEMEQASITAAKQWEFTPAKYKGKIVECWVTIPFKFKLQ